MKSHFVEMLLQIPIFILILIAFVTVIVINIVTINYVYISAGAHVESLINARLNEDAELRITTSTAHLDHLAACITHSTFFTEKREELYGVRQKVENTTGYYSRIIII